MENFIKGHSDVALHFVLHAYRGIRRNLENVTSEGYKPVVLWGGVGANHGRIWLSEMGLITSNPTVFLLTPWCTVRWATSHRQGSSDIKFFSLDGANHPSARDAGFRTMKTYMFFEGMRLLTDTMKLEFILPVHVQKLVDEVEKRV